MRYLPKYNLVCCVLLWMAASMVQAMVGVCNEPFETSFGGVAVSDGLAVNASWTSTPKPAGYTSPNPAMMYSYGAWDASHWVEWSATNSPFSTGSYSLAWKSTSLTPSSGNWNRLNDSVSTNTDPYTNGVVASMDLWTNDNNPDFEFRLGLYNNLLLEFGNITSTICYAGYNLTRKTICSYSLSTWYRVIVR
ncbi:MAG TPA: hypothetical protein VGL77_14805, partial [Armatimonadota bacterium]